MERVRWRYLVRSERRVCESINHSVARLKHVLGDSNARQGGHGHRQPARSERHTGERQANRGQREVKIDWQPCLEVRQRADTWLIFSATALPEPIRPLFVVLYHIGARIGEMIRLEWRPSE